MNVRGALRSLYRTVRPGPKPHAVVLMYHRVAVCDIDPWNLCVSPQRFAEHLEALKRSYRIVPLRELTGTDAPRSAVAITFDDGYADNLHEAAPLLEHHEAPACFFLTSGALGMAREFWWDELERLLLRKATLPSTIKISVGGSARVFELGRAAEPANDLRGEIRANPPWKAGPKTRLGFYYAVWQALRALDEHARRIALDEIALQVAEDAGTRFSHRTLTSDEARHLAGCPGMDIGAHSVTHASLPSLKPEAQSLEIRQSKEHLEKLLGRPITAFAYPFGDYGAETAELVRTAGFEFACTTEAGGITRNSDRFRLPRLGVEDCDGPQLLRRISSILG
jgi:peptidoglycan/xylan/chitin deacetylase (PgdA/CDA1 family)